MSAAPHPAAQRLDPASVSLPTGHALRKLAPAAAVVAAVALVAAAAMGWGSRQFFFSYLVAFTFFVSLALGGMFFVLVQHAARAGWSVVVRRLAENAMATLPVLALLFVPLAFGVSHLYEWSHAEEVAADPLLAWKQPWLNATGFIVRGGIVFALWILIATWFGRQSVRQDGSGEHAITRRMTRLAGPALIVYALTVTMAAFDWIMSLEPHWYSTIFGVYYFAGAVVGTFSLLILSAIVLQGFGLLGKVVTVEHFHDLGKLLFAFTVFWAYIAFSQYLLIWYGNIPEETAFFAHRFKGSWLAVSQLLVVGHFVVPFFFLMPRTIKRHRGTLALGAAWMLFMHAVDLYWLVMPLLHESGPQVGLLDVLAFVGVGSAFVAAYVHAAGRRALVPLADPRLPESLAFENA